MPNFSLEELKAQIEEEFDTEKLEGAGIDLHKLAEKGFSYLGSGAQSLAFATPSNKSVIKFAHNSYTIFKNNPNQYQDKVKRTNAAAKLYKTVGIPLFSPRARMIHYAGKEALIQRRVQGPTLGKMWSELGESNPNYLDNGDFLKTIRQTASQASDDPRRRTMGLERPLVDIASAENFVVPQHNVELLKSLISKSSTGKELGESWQTSGIHIGAIDLAKGFIPNFAGNIPMDWEGPEADWGGGMARLTN